MSLLPDGKLLALGTGNRAADIPGSIQIFDMVTRQLLRECRAPGRHQYLGVLFSPDGAMLASYSYPGKTIHLWDAATAKELRRWPVKSAVTCFIFSRDGKTLIAGDGPTIHFWDAATGVKTRHIDGHPGVVSRLTLSSDGKMLVSQGMKKEPGIGEDHQNDNKVYLWDAVSGKNLRQIEVAEKESIYGRGIRHFEFSRDGKVLITASSTGIVAIWDPNTGNELRRWETGEFAHHFALAPNGKTLALLGGGNTIRLFDLATGQERHEHAGHRHGVRLVALSRDGRMLATGNRDGCIWNATTAHEAHQLRFGAAILDIHFSGDSQALVTLGADKRLVFWDSASGKELRHLQAPVEGRIGLHARSPDGKTLATVYDDQRAEKTKIVLWKAS